MSADITLDGEGYMIAPGSYRRASDGAPDARSGTVALSDFAGGQRRALQLERDRGWDAVGVGPAMDGQGVEPWPSIEAFTDTAIAPVSTVRAPQLVLDPYAYVAVGQFLYRTVALSASSWAAMTQVADVGSGKTITRLALYQGDVLLCCGNGLDVQRYSPATGTTTTLSAGLKARLGIGYAGQLVFADPAAGSEHVLHMTTGGTPDARELDAPIANLGLHDGKVAIATRQSLWLLDGRADPTTHLWTTDPQPFFSHGIWTDDEDFLFLLSFGGKLYTWLANGVMEWNPSGDNAGWRATAIEGRSCNGATVAGDRLIVSIITRSGDSEIWAFDGAGWWLMLRASNQARVWPMFAAGAGNIDLVLFRDGSTSVTYDLVRLVYRHELAANYGITGEYRTSLLDGNERALQKAWQRIGAVFAMPEDRGNPASTNAVSVSLSYSADGGASWIAAATASFADPTQRLGELVADLRASPVISRLLQLRVEFSGAVDWSPVLAGLWADYDAIGISPRRRRWQFAIHARDRTVLRRDGIDARDGRAIAADLWSAWQSATPIAFQDVDFAATGRTYSVRVVSIKEDVASPANAGSWGDSLVTLELAEV